MKEKTNHIKLISCVIILQLVISYSLSAQPNQTSEQIPAHLDSLYTIESGLAQNYYEEMLHTLPKEGLEKQFRKVIYRQLQQAYAKGDYLKTVRDCSSYLSIVSEDTKWVALVLTVMGNSYYYLNENILALNAYMKAKSVNESLNDSINLSTSFSSIALIHSRTGNYREALRNNKTSLSLEKSLNLNTISSGYLNVGRNYFHLKEFDSSKLYLDSAYALVTKENQETILPYTLRSYSDMYFKKEKYDSALIYIKQSIDKAKYQSSKEDLFVGVVDISDIWLRSEEYDKVIAICLQHLPMAHELRNYTRVIDISKKLYLAFIAKGYYEAAVNVERQFRPIQDSLNYANSSNAKRRTQLLFEAERQESENIILKQKQLVQEEKIKNQTILLFGGLLGIFLFSLISFVVYKAYIQKKKLSTQIQKHADKLTMLDEAKSRFFANISHDLRTPLTLMMGGISQVLENKDILLNLKSEKQLKTALINGDRIIHLTNEINDLIQLEEGKLKLEMQKIDLNELLKLFESMFESMASLKGVKLTYIKSIFDLPTLANLDPHHFEKVLFNLITNAIKHTPEGGNVAIELKANHDQLSISIRDSGEGIPEKNIPHIFDRYYQAPDTTFKIQEGFGIGLALVKEIVAQHQAKIEVISKLGEGSVFTITLPVQTLNDKDQTENISLAYTSEKHALFKDIQETANPERPLVQIASITNDTSKKRVLLVEDHPEVRAYITDIIEAHYVVLTANDGKKALEVLEKEAVDLIITDLMMPWFDGFELLEKLRDDETLRKIPALVISARTSQEDKNKVLTQGVNDFLCKPFNPSELMARMDNLLARKEFWNNADKNALIINSTQTLDDIEKSLLKKIELLIVERISDSALSVNYLASEIAVSERKFYRMIKKLTGTTPFELIKEVRLLAAEKIIKEKRINSATEVAKAVGINNVSSFNTQFKKRFGKKPSDLFNM